jgi:hypothetical protein
MTRRDDQATARVQVYFENPKLEQALRREARSAKIPLSRAAERAIGRGLVKRPGGGPEDRLLALERGFRDHMRSTARDMSILQELLVEVARIFLQRLPDTPADEDPLLLAVVEARIQRMFDAAAGRIAAGGSAGFATEPGPNGAAPPAAEARSFRQAV